MHYKIIFMLLVSFQIIPPILNVTKKADDKALVAFIGGMSKFEEFCAQQLATIKEDINSLSQVNGIYLGALFYLREEWDCEKAFEFDPSKHDVCNNFHANLDVLYKYFYNVYAGGAATVKPGFEDRYDIYIYRYMISNIMSELLKIWKFDLKLKYNLNKKDDERDKTVENHYFIRGLKLIKKYGLYYKTNNFDKKRELRAKYLYGEKGVIDERTQKLLAQNYGSYFDAINYLKRDFNPSIDEIHEGLNMAPLEQEARERFLNHLEILEEYWSIVGDKLPAVMPKFENRSDLDGSDFSRLTRVMKNLVDMWKCEYYEGLIEADDKKMAKRKALLYIHNLVLKNEEELNFSGKNLENQKNFTLTEKKVIDHRSKEHLTQNYKAYFDALKSLYHCDSILRECNLEPREYDECEPFLKHLGILREYWSNVDAELPTVMPIYENKNDLGGCDFSRLTRVMKNLVDIENWSTIEEDKKKAFLYIHNLVLKNEKELDYIKNLEQKAEKQKNTNDYDAVKKAKFDEIIQKMSKQAEEKFLEGFPLNYDMAIMMQDEAFVAVVRDKNHLVDIVNMHGFGSDFYHGMNFEVESLEGRVVALYLMKKHWNCAKFKDDEFEERCINDKQFLDMIYEYLCNAHAGFTDVMPQFHIGGYNVDLIRMIDVLSEESKLRFVSNSAETSVNRLNKSYGDNSKIRLHEIGIQMAFDWIKDNQQISANDVRKLAQHNFEQYLKKMLKKWIKKALGIKAEIDALAEKIIKNEGQQQDMEDEKFYYGIRKHSYESHIVFGSPFFGITL